VKTGNRDEVTPALSEKGGQGFLGGAPGQEKTQENIKTNRRALVGDRPEMQKHPSNSAGDRQKEDQGTEIKQKTSHHPKSSKVRQKKGLAWREMPKRLKNSRKRRVP